MQIIIQKATFDEPKLRTYLTELTANELSNLAEPCYYSEWKKHYFELLHLIELTDDDIKSFSKRFYVETKIQTNLAQYGKVPKLLQDPGSNLLIILMYHFLTKKDVKMYSTTMIYYMIRQYNNFLRDNLKFCKPEVFSYTLNHLNSTHLFIREKTISNALFHLASEMKKRYTDGFSELNPDKISNFVFESRSRIAQSLRSFLEAYYNFESKGLSISNPLESEEGEEIQTDQLKKGERIAELVSKKICIYKEINYKALEDARKITKINTSLSVVLVDNLQNVNLVNDIKFIIELFLKNAKSVNDICGKNFLNYVKSLMSIKRTTKTVFFKQEINKLLTKIIENTPYKSKYLKLTSQTQFQINSFLSFYLTMYTRNLIC